MLNFRNYTPKKAQYIFQEIAPFVFENNFTKSDFLVPPLILYDGPPFILYDGPPLILYDGPPFILYDGTNYNEYRTISQAPCRD